MSHEIYYTSAPEGLKRGTSGFCTVAASDNIPKPLWDRLETLSAYRHHFGTGAQENPVSHAHWILNISGKTHHVLSRICDSGVDHTQRTNAFAHHLVLETAELEAALGGPAWLLEQPGVMAQRWDGANGTLPPNRLARGDIFSSSRICQAWAAATGDAGWGGHLADLFAKSPTRPLCILFAPGHEMLPLMAEAIALLPPAARWNVTFNTYFTSMPTSATCLWRCCLAGTPAAQIGLRYAANGLILDLTDRSRLPALPPGPFVTMARTGEAAPSAKPASPKMAPPAADAKSRNAKSPIAPSSKTSPPGPPDGEGPAELPRRESIFDFATPTERPPDVPHESRYELREAGVPTASAPIRGRRGAATPPPARLIRHAEEALEEARQQETLAAVRRRKQVMLLFAGALGAIAVGSGLIYLATRDSGPRELPAPNAIGPKPSATTPTIVAPIIDNTPQTIAATENMPPTMLVETRPIVPPPDVPPPPTITYPPILTLLTAIDRPNLGTGIGDRTQLLALRAADLDKIPVSALRLSFFNGQTSRLNASADAATYNGDALGTLTAQGDQRAGKPGVALRWKEKGETGTGAECLFLAFDKTRPGLDVQWHSGVLLKNPGLFSFIYWTLQSSSIVLERPAGAAPQRIAALPFVPAPVNYAPADSDLTWPVDLPRDVKVTEPLADSLPPGWRAEWYPDWENKDPSQRTPENASQVIKFKKPTAIAAVDAWFLLTFRPDLTKIESTFSKRMDSDQRDLARFESDLRAIDSQIEDVKSRNNGVLGDSQGARDLAAKRDQTVTLIEAYKSALAGYNELNKLDITLEMPDGTRLTTLHFQRPNKATPSTEAGK